MLKKNGKTRLVAGVLAAALTISAVPAALAEAPAAGGFENGKTALSMELAARYDSGSSNADGGVMEIVDYNAENGFAYAINGQSGTLAQIDLDQMKEGQTLQGATIDVRALVSDESFAYGDMTSVAVSPDGKHLAAAIQAENYADSGRVALFTCNADGSLTFEKTVETGVQPDMVTYTPDGSYILTANEGEPREGYTEPAVDPAGSVSIVDVAAGTVQTVDFTAFDAQREQLVAQGIVLKSGSNPSTDLEPEYIACSNTTAYVTLQEANAIAVLDLASGSFTGIYSAGLEDYSQVEIDLDKKDEAYQPATYASLRGLRMPDGITLVQVDGTDYLLTANEGDSREWGDYLNEDERNFGKNETSPSGKITAQNSTLTGKVVFFDAADYDGLDQNLDYVFGGRSFTMLRVTPQGLEEVFTSGSDFEAKTAAYLPEYFNCSNDDLTIDDRSGKKGPEPETVTVGTVGDQTYAFVTLERIGGVMAYDITNPEETTYVNYINSRDFSADVAADDSPEGLKFIPASESPTGQALLLAACEVGGTVAAYTLYNTEKELAFQDVSQDAYYYEAVRWATDNGIVAGTSESTFSPDQTCTRAEMAAFLWRAAGRTAPEAQSCPFTDVSSEAYYYEAVCWAWEQGIISGTSATTFQPNQTCVRAHSVSCLWRMDGKQSATAESPFTDLVPGAYYEDAVLWAYENGIVSGITETTFGPEVGCTRAQFVALLYRYLAQ